VGDRWGLAVTLGSLAYLARLRDSYPQASRLTEEALGLFRELGDKAGIATSLMRLAQVAFRRGSYPQAEELIQEGQALQREVDEIRGLITAQSLLGLIACYQGRYDEAAAQLQASRQRGEAYWGAEATNFIANYEGLVAYYRGDTATAQHLWTQGLAVQRLLEDRSGAAYCLFGLGRLAYDRGNLEEARRHLEESLELFKHAGDRRYMAIVLNALGTVLYAQGHAEQGLGALQKGLLMRKESGDRQGLAESFESLAVVLLTRPGVAPESLAQLLGGVAALREDVGAPVPPVERAALARAADELGQRLGSRAAYEQCWQAGFSQAAAQPEKVLETAWAALSQAAPPAG
jgi:tetratricopeptide (TPR) repeat protein